jgi:sarcosine oxidase
MQELGDPEAAPICVLRQVLGLEQYSVAHDRGSSHGESRIIRLAYHEHPDYVPLLKRAWTLWEDLQEKTGQVPIRPCFF